jgi:hypothetical protein
MTAGYTAVGTGTTTTTNSDRRRDVKAAEHQAKHDLEATEKTRYGLNANCLPTEPGDSTKYVQMR